MLKYFKITVCLIRSPFPQCFNRLLIRGSIATFFYAWQQPWTVNVKGYNFFYPAEFAIFKCSKLDQLAPPPYELLGSFCSQATLSPITPPTSSTPQWTIFIKEKLILISFFIHILQLLSYNGKNNVHNVDNFFNFVSFTYTQKNLTIFSLVILRN